MSVTLALDRAGVDVGLSVLVQCGRSKVIVKSYQVNNYEAENDWECKKLFIVYLWGEHLDRRLCFMNVHNNTTKP